MFPIVIDHTNIHSAILCSTHCLAEHLFANKNEGAVVSTSKDPFEGQACSQCGKELPNTLAKFTYFNQCDRWRIRYPNGEEQWQEMMANKYPLPIEEFLLLADTSDLLDEDETLSDFVADDPDHGFFISTANKKPVMFIAHAGFEFIFTEDGESPD